MPTITGILTSIKTVIANTTGVGQVHSYRRYVVNDAAFKAIGVTGSRVNFWQLWRQSVDERWPNAFQYQLIHHIQVQGFYSSKDASASEHTFQTLVDRIANRFRLTTNRTLTDTVESLAAPGGMGGLQIQAIDHSMQYGNLSHACRGKIVVVENPTNFPD